jgi:F-type H+-transporting ATPase subunit epsilon
LSPFKKIEKQMFVEIITPDRQVFSGEADSVTLPGTEGSFQVLNHHAALVSMLEKGQIVVRNEGKEQIWTVEGGVVEVLENRVNVLAEAVL